VTARFSRTSGLRVHPLQTSETLEPEFPGAHDVRHGADGQVLIVGGSTGSSFLSISTPPPGSGAPAQQQALHSAELYNPTSDDRRLHQDRVDSVMLGRNLPASLHHRTGIGLRLGQQCDFGAHLREEPR
jgi:hypothetical protein